MWLFCAVDLIFTQRVSNPNHNCTNQHNKKRLLEKHSQFSDMDVMKQFAARFGAPGEIRTHNRLIRSQMLYPLSYGGDAAKDYNLEVQVGKAVILLYWVGKL